MRTDSHERAPDLGDGPSGPIERLRRWMAAQDAPTRRRVAIAGLVVVVAAVYLLASGGREGTSTFWLQDGRAFTTAEARSLSEALAERGIAVSPGPRGQLGVPAEHSSQALKILSQKGLLRRSLEELVDEPVQPSLWADPADRERARLRHREQRIEAKLEEFDGLLSSTVLLHERKGKRFGEPASLRATVFVTPRDSGDISSDLLGRIETTLVNMEPDLQRGRDVTVIDHTGRSYLEAGDPTVKLKTLADARAHGWETELSRRLASQVDGIRVSVRLEWPLSEPSGSEVDADATAVVPNAPVAIEVPEPVARANVLVEVPSQYFLDRYRAMAGPESIPTQEALEPLVVQTSELIRQSVGFEIPRESLGELRIVKLPLPVRRATVVGAGASPKRDLRPWWAAAAAAGGLVLILALTAGGRRLAMGRRTARVGPIPGPHFDEADRPGPADRVRELVRRDPEAAAGVLRRWVGQGGTQP